MFESYLIPLRIKNGQREKEIDGTPSEYIKLYTKCWDENPEERTTMEFILITLNTITWEMKGTPKSDTTLTPIHDEDVENLVALSLPVSMSIGVANLSLGITSPQTMVEEIDENRVFLEQIQSEIKSLVIENVKDDRLQEIMEKNNKKGESAFMLLQQQTYILRFQLL